MERGDAVPHVTVTALDGRRISYASSVWQQKQLVLVALGERSAETDAYAARVSKALADSTEDTAVILTHDAVPGLEPRGALVADRWGEIVDVKSAATIGELPEAEDLAAWIAHVRQRCPECEGETR
jgi:hypothetical protein